MKVGREVCWKEFLNEKAVEGDFYLLCVLERGSLCHLLNSPEYPLPPHTLELRATPAPLIEQAQNMPSTCIFSSNPQDNSVTEEVSLPPFPRWEN